MQDALLEVHTDTDVDVGGSEMVPFKEQKYLRTIRCCVQLQEARRGWERGSHAT